MRVEIKATYGDTKYHGCVDMLTLPQRGDIMMIAPDDDIVYVHQAFWCITLPEESKATDLLQIEEPYGIVQCRYMPPDAGKED